MHRELEWDPKHAFLNIRARLPDIAGSDRRKLVSRMLDECQARLAPLLPRLPMQVIHTDVNEHNLLVGEDERVSGIIDFGDVVHSYRVCDLAHTAAYLMLGRDDVGVVVAELVRGFQQRVQLDPDELMAAPDFMRLRLCLSVSMTARQRKLDPDNEYLTVSEEPAWRVLETLDAEDGDSIAEALQIPRCRPRSVRSPADILRARGRLLSGGLNTSYREPLEIVRGTGQYLFASDGRRYLDCVNNVCHVGHCHPHVVAAGREQMARLNTNTRYLHDHLVEYAERLTALLPDPLAVCFFVNSGSEANDLALRLARAHTNAEDMVVIDHAYHGNTRSLIDVSPYKYDGRGGQGQPVSTHKVPVPDLYRGCFGSDDPDAGQKYAGFVAQAVTEVERTGRPLAGFMAESMLGVAGQIVLPPGFLATAYETTRRAGGVCIADEVQVGFGRVGPDLWAFVNQGVVPDILTLGKPIGNGHPLAAVVTTAEIARSFETGMEYFNTFGGNPVSCAIGLAVLDVIESERLPEHAAEVGAYFSSSLTQLATRHESIGDVRGRGLFLGVEFVRDRKTREPATSEAAQVVELMLQRGVLVSTDGPHNCVLKIKPPLVFTRADVDRFVQALDAGLSEIERGTESRSGR